jgi:transcriptional regulator with XRE-family HTH domain
MGIIGTAAHQPLGDIKMNAALVAHPGDDLFDLVHNFGANAVAGQDQDRWVCHVTLAAKSVAGGLALGAAGVKSVREKWIARASRNWQVKAGNCRVGGADFLAIYRLVWPRFRCRLVCRLTMILRKYLLRKGLSQDQLSVMSGVSVRTIQRIERGKPASCETLKCLAAALEVDFTILHGGDMMANEPTATAAEVGLSDAERDALEFVDDLKGFYTHGLLYLVVIAILGAWNLLISPQHIWVHYVAMGWGIGVAAHGLSVFDVIRQFGFGAEWEQRQVERRLRR